jgi:periplasmic protein TonB
VNAVAEDFVLDTKPVDAADRLSFTLFLALALHAVVILGINFTMPPAAKTSQTIEITLATHKSRVTPKEADFIAQHNQEASGTEEKARQITTEKLAEFAHTQVRNVNPIPQVAAASPEQQKAQQILTTTGKTDLSIQAVKKIDPKDEVEKRKGLLENQTAMSAEIASLQAKLDKQRQEYAKRPRIRTLTSVSTKESFDAKYLHEWGEKVERIGNLNYPKEALTNSITGSLRLSVIINPDGTIYQIEVLQSSGQRILDDAARQIVRLAAPFAKFPPEIRLQSDRLQIIRTWKFEMSGLSTSAK